MKKIDINNLLDNKYTIRSSNISLRFYKSDGWTKELIESLIKHENPSLYYRDSMELGDGKNSYFVLLVGSSNVIDIELLLSMKKNLIRTFDDNPNETDEEFIKAHI